VEYRAARETMALFDTAEYAYSWLEGPDRARYMNAIFTNNIKDLLPGQGVEGLLLNPQGHILAELYCFNLGERFLLEYPAQVAERTLAWLDKYLIMDDATLTDASAELASVAVEGPQAAALLHDSCGLKLEDMPVLAHAEAQLGAISCRVVRTSHFGSTGAAFIARRDALPGLWNALADAVRARGGALIGCAALNSLRLEAGIPWFGYDFDDKVIPHEAGLEHSHINYTKGCYTGQEIVERVRSRGQVNRVRAGLKFSSPEPPAQGTKLHSQEKEAGHVTSAAFSPLLGCAIGMACLRREFATPGTMLESAAGASEVISLPLRPSAPRSVRAAPSR